MNIAIIFAGGTGSRMHTTSRPKQFLEYQGKPIIIYTLELFDNHSMIDGIVVACVEAWIPFLEKMLKKFEINKVMRIVSGGETGQESIYKGIVAAKDISESSDDIVLIHDGVRPLITEQTITDNIKMAVEVMFRSFPADIGTYQDIPYPASSGVGIILRLCRCRNAIGRGWIA